MTDNNPAPAIDIHKLAVALTYDKDADPAPRIAAKGRGHIAEKIIALAQEHGIEIREDTDLAVLLAKLDLDTLIPVEAYAAVAEILAYVYETNDKMKRTS